MDVGWWVAAADDIAVDDEGDEVDDGDVDGDVCIVDDGDDIVDELCEDEEGEIGLDNVERGKQLAPEYPSLHSSQSIPLQLGLLHLQWPRIRRRGVIIGTSQSCRA